MASMNRGLTHKILKQSVLSFFAWLEKIEDLFSWIGRRGCRQALLPEPDANSRGVSILIPERDNVDCLRECLGNLREAVSRIADPYEIIVIVNGSARSLYRQLELDFPFVRWFFFPQPLWFSGAVDKGLQMAQHEWVYLLNNDMLLEPEALLEVLKWRGPRVFAVASQIFFLDRDKRREETGWTQYRVVDQKLELFDAFPEDDHTVRGNLYAGGGSSLFQKEVLKKLIKSSRTYRPCYWEDAEWGMTAWRLGYQILFCPASRAWHHHRATHSKVFSPRELERIFQRNFIKLILRTRLVQPLRSLFGAQWADCKEMDIFRMLLWGLPGLLWARWRSCFLPHAGLPLESTWKKYFFVPFEPSSHKPVLLVATPYAIYPPAHGGAVRLCHLIRELSSSYQVHLLSDEENLYSPRSTRYFSSLTSLHLAGGRVEPSASELKRIGRIKSHSHPSLCEQLRHLIATLRPDYVQIEFVELCQLIKVRNGPGPFWILTLHDVLLSSSLQNFTEEDHFEWRWVRQYDAVAVVCREDAQLIPAGKIAVVPNGAILNPGRYVSSAQSQGILFIGPFRYPPNRHGIELFLAKVFPNLKAEFPGLELWILGGEEVCQMSTESKLFQQDGVCLFEFTEDPRQFLDRCALTINPLFGIRGTSLKLIESLAAGRVCVSSAEAARGFSPEELPALVLANSLEDFGPLIAQLLRDPAARIRLERPDEAVFQKYSWKSSAQQLKSLYQNLDQNKVDFPGSRS